MINEIISLSEDYELSCYSIDKFRTCPSQAPLGNANCVEVANGCGQASVLKLIIYR
ncbi:MAG: hypothetical protein RR262_07540 [Clostridium sp.]